jgi:hypothetical protein
MPVVHKMSRTHIVYLCSSVKPSSVERGCKCENWDIGMKKKLLGGPR